MDGHTAFAIIALLVSLACLVYVVLNGRHTRAMLKGMAHRRALGNDAWIKQQIQRWANGEIQSHTEKGIGVSGTDVEVIEPLPGWKIVVGTVGHGKMVPFNQPGNKAENKRKTVCWPFTSMKP